MTMIHLLLVRYNYTSYPINEKQAQIHLFEPVLHLFFKKLLVLYTYVKFFPERILFPPQEAQSRTQFWPDIPVQN